MHRPKDLDKETKLICVSRSLEILNCVYTRRVSLRSCVQTEAPTLLAEQLQCLKGCKDNASDESCQISC